MNVYSKSSPGTPKPAFQCGWLSISYLASCLARDDQHQPRHTFLNPFSLYTLEENTNRLVYGHKLDRPGHIMADDELAQVSHATILKSPLTTSRSEQHDLPN